jgi:Recombination, repair and ssDNA binding protein UvsY
MLISDLPKLKAKIDSDLKITEDNVASKSLNSAYMYHQYLDLWLSELRELKTLGLEKDRIYGVLYDKYKFKHDQQLSGRPEIESWIFADPLYIKVATEYIDKETVVKYLENVTEAISKLSFGIKNYIEYKKFLSGG